jgi:hypothetical protein
MKALGMINDSCFFCGFFVVFFLMCYVLRIPSLCLPFSVAFERWDVCYYPADVSGGVRMVMRCGCVCCMLMN